MRNSLNALVLSLAAMTAAPALEKGKEHTDAIDYERTELRTGIGDVLHPGEHPTMAKGKEQKKDNKEVGRVIPPGEFMKKIVSPVPGKDWKADTAFGDDCTIETENGKKIYMGKRVGQEMFLPAGTPVVACGPGYVRMIRKDPGAAPGFSARGRGTTVVVCHWPQKEKTLPKDQHIMYTIYSGIKVDPKLKEGTYIKEGTSLGTVAPAMSRDNGFWPDAHLFLQINLDPSVTDSFIDRQGLPTAYAKAKSLAPNRLDDNFAPSEIFGATIDPIQYAISVRASRQEIENQKKKKK